MTKTELKCTKCEKTFPIDQVCWCGQCGDCCPEHDEYFSRTKVLAKRC